MKAESWHSRNGTAWEREQEGRELNGTMSQKLNLLGCDPEEGLSASHSLLSLISLGKEALHVDLLQRLEEALVWTLVRSLEGRRRDKVAVERVVRQSSSERGYLTAEKTDGKISGREKRIGGGQ